MVSMCFVFKKRQVVANEQIGTSENCSISITWPDASTKSGLGPAEKETDTYRPTEIETAADTARK